MDERELEGDNIPEEVMEPSEKKPSDGFRRSVLDWLETIVMAIVLVAVLFTFVARIITVDGGSMEPNYYNGDRVLVSGMAGKIEQGDIVIVVHALKDPIIKRVIATEGQTVDFDPELGEVTVDGKPVKGEEFGIANGITTNEFMPGITLDFPQTVPENCVFVMGDNRQNSTDSRFAEVGMVDHRNILGKVFFNVYPFSKFGIVG